MRDDEARYRRRFDGEVVRLAVPAFGALVAEPLYLLADTAVVGHLGTAQLGGLAIASSVLVTTFVACNFLAYGTTSAVARRLGAGDEAAAAHEGVQGLWLGALLGVVLVAVGWPLAPWLIRLFTHDPAVAHNATVYLRFSLPGAPAMLVVTAGTGYLRGLQDTRTPLLVAVTTAAVNLAAELIAIEVFGFGIGASALATVAVQWLGGAWYVAVIGHAVRAHPIEVAPDGPTMRRLARVGGALFVRVMVLRLALIGATAVAARRGRVAVGAYGIAYEVWNTLALALDALAIAGQALVGRFLGAGDRDSARAVSQRLITLGIWFGAVVAAGTIAVRPWLPHVFTSDHRVASVAAFLLWFVAVLQPLNAVAFVLDGVLIGAGDLAYLARAMVVSTAAFGVAAAVVVITDGGVGWLWAALGTWMLVRAATLVWRWRGDGWLVVGAER